MRNRLPSLFDADLYDGEPKIETGLLGPWEDQNAPREQPMMMAQNLMFAPYTNMPPDERHRIVERGRAQADNLGRALEFGGMIASGTKTLGGKTVGAGAEWAGKVLQDETAKSAWGNASADKAEFDRQRALYDFNRAQLLNYLSRYPIAPR